MIFAMCLDNEEAMAADEALFKEQKSNCNCFCYHRPSAGLYKKVRALSWVGVTKGHIPLRSLRARAACKAESTNLTWGLILLPIPVG